MDSNNSIRYLDSDVILLRHDVEITTNEKAEIYKRFRNVVVTTGKGNKYSGSFVKFYFQGEIFFFLECGIFQPYSDEGLNSDSISKVNLQNAKWYMPAREKHLGLMSAVEYIYDVAIENQKQSEDMKTSKSMKNQSLQALLNNAYQIIKQRHIEIKAFQMNMYPIKLSNLPCLGHPKAANKNIQNEQLVNSTNFSAAGFESNPCVQEWQKRLKSNDNNFIGCQIDQESYVCLQKVICVGVHTEQNLPLLVEQDKIRLIDASLFKNHSAEILRKVPWYEVMKSSEKKYLENGKVNYLIFRPTDMYVESQDKITLRGDLKTVMVVNFRDLLPSKHGKYDLNFAFE